jgi:hypothetical protein
VLSVLLSGTLGASCNSDDTAGTATPPTPTAAIAEGTVTSASVPATLVAFIDPGDGGRYAPKLDPANFVSTIDNPYLPMPVGAHWRYKGESDGEIETIDVVVTDQHRQVVGIEAVVVRDTVTIGGEVVEDTYDWYAQDRDGNVWYLGEAVKDIEKGVVVSTKGSWEAGVDGALPGIVMPGTPKVGDAYRQEFLSGEAEDMMVIVATDATLQVPTGSFTGVVTTDDWTPLDAGVVERKAYAPGVGKIREEKTRGGNGFAELVDYSLKG